MIRPCSSGFSPVGSQKLPRREPAQPHCVACSTACMSSSGNFFPCINPSLPFFRLSKPSSIRLFSQPHPPDLDHLGGSPLDHFSWSLSFPHWGTQNCLQCLTCSLVSAGTRGMNKPFLPSTGCAPVNTAHCCQVQGVQGGYRLLRLGLLSCPCPVVHSQKPSPQPLMKAGVGYASSLQPLRTEWNLCLAND